MIYKTIDVVKKNQAHDCGTVRLGNGDKNAPVRPSTPSRAVPQGAIQAKLIETNDQYALIEVICSCGVKTQIQCRYASETVNA